MAGLYRQPPPYPHPQRVRPKGLLPAPPVHYLTCSAECQLDLDEGQTDVTRHWADANGTLPVFEMVDGRTWYRWDVGSSNLRHSIGAGHRVAKGLLKFRVSDATPSSVQLIAWLGNPYANFGLQISTGGVLQVVWGGDVGNGPTIVADTTYMVEWQADVSVTPYRIKWRVWDAGTWTDQTDRTRTGGEPPTTFNADGWAIGPGAGPASGAPLYVTDLHLITGQTTDEFYSGTPQATTEIGSLLPTGDGTHAFTTNDFSDGGAGLDPSSTTIYTAIDKDDMSAGDGHWIQQDVAGAGKYVEVTFADVPAEITVIGVVEIVAAVTMSTGPGFDELGLRVSDNGTDWVDVWCDWANAVGFGVDSFSLTSRSFVLPTAPSGGAWTPTKLNGLRARFGNSTDVAPAPRLQALKVEYEHEAAAESASGSSLAGEVAGATSSVKKSVTGSDLAGTAAGPTAQGLSGRIGSDLAGTAAGATLSGSKAAVGQAVVGGLAAGPTTASVKQATGSSLAGEVTGPTSEGAPSVPPVIGASLAGEVTAPTSEAVKTAVGSGSAGCVVVPVSSAAGSRAGSAIAGSAMQPTAAILRAGTGTEAGAVVAASVVAAGKIAGGTSIGDSATAPSGSGSKHAVGSATGTLLSTPLVSVSKAVSGSAMGGLIAPATAASAEVASASSLAGLIAAPSLSGLKHVIGRSQAGIGALPNIETVRVSTGLGAAGGALVVSSSSMAARDGAGFGAVVGSSIAGGTKSAQVSALAALLGLPVVVAFEGQLPEGPMSGTIVPVGAPGGGMTARRVTSTITPRAVPSGTAVRR